MQVRMMMKFFQISLFLTSLFFAPILAHGAKAMEEEPHPMSLELVHRSHPKFTPNKSVDMFEQFRQYAQNDIARQERWFQSQSQSLSRETWSQSQSLRGERRPEIQILNSGPRIRKKDYESIETPIHAGRDSGACQYMVQVKVGTPPQTFWLNADTGSDLTWFYCNNNNKSGRRGGRRKKTQRRKPAENGESHRVFNTKRSRTYHQVVCSSDKCRTDLSPMYSIVPCAGPLNPCEYDYYYEDGTNAIGVFGTDTFTVSQTNGKTEEIPDVLIGCTSKLVSPGDTLKEDGVLGLGAAAGTFLEKAALKYGKKLSYCLVNHMSHRNVSSFLTFGDYNKARAKLLGEMRQTTLLVMPPFYAANVLGISIDGKKLDTIPREIFDLKNNHSAGMALIDSGTSLASLPEPAYKVVTDILTKPFEKLQRLVDDIEPFEHCYNSRGFDRSKVPRLAFHFEGGVTFEPTVRSYVLDVAPGIVCIGIVEPKYPTNAITIGNVMQQDHLWEFNLGQNILKFVPAVCT